MEYSFIKFGVDSSSGFSFRARTHTQTREVRDATDHPTHALATAGVGDYGAHVVQFVQHALGYSVP